MTTYELIAEIDKVMGCLAANKYILQVLSRLSDLHDKLLNVFVEIIGSPEVLSTDKTIEKVSTSSRSLSGEIQPHLREIKTRVVFVEIDRLEAVLREFISNMNSQVHEPIDKLHQKLVHFSSTYEDYIKRYETADAIRVLIAAKLLHEEISTTRAMVMLVRESLGGSTLVQDSPEGTLSILLRSHYEFSELVNKLAALDSLYIELCELFNVSAKQHPLDVIKIELGSLWARVFGEPRIITLLISLLESAIGFLHRSYTRDGKIMALPKRVETIVSLLDLEHKMKEAGIDTSDLQHSIQKSSVLISRNLNTLLAGEAVVRINDREYSVGLELERKLLEREKPLFLEGGHESEEKGP